MHWRSPRRHSDWWVDKVNGTAERDANTTAMLEAAGWLVIRVWEHENAEQAAARIAKVVHGRGRRNAEERSEHSSRGETGGR